MTALAQELAKTKKQRHEKVEEFFLTNDSATIVIEVPVYLTKEDPSKKQQDPHPRLQTGPEREQPHKKLLTSIQPMDMA